MINRLLTLTLMLSVLLFGSVEIWSLTAVQFTIFTIGIIWIIKGEYRTYHVPRTIMLLIITLFAFLSYGVFQAIPLPPSLLKLISPLSFQLQSFYSVDPAGAMSVSLNAYRTVYETIKGAAFLTVFAICAVSFSDRNKLQETLKALCVFGFCLAIFAIVQKATWGKGIYWFRELTQGGTPFGPFVNRNHYAGLMDMLIPLGLGLSLTQRSREKKLLFGFMTVVMAASLFLSLSRGGIMSFFAGVALFALLMTQGEKQSRRPWLIGAFVAAVLCYVIYLGIDPIIERFYKTDVSTEERLVVWSSTWDAIRGFWLTGSGLGSFINVFPLYTPAPVRLLYDHAHNDYLEFFLETGLVGTVFLLLFLALLIHTFMKFSFNGRKGLLNAAALSSVFTMMIHSIFDFNLHILSNLLMFACVLGMVAALSSMQDNEEKGAGIKEKETDRILASMIKRPAARRRRSAPLFEETDSDIHGQVPADKGNMPGDEPDAL